MNRNPLQRFFLSRFFRKASLLLQSAQPRTFLDVGCGEGFFMNYVLQTMPHLQGQGIDIDDEALQRGRTLFPTLSLQHGNVFNMPFSSCSFDIVTCLELLEHVQETERALAELKQVTSRHCLISVPNEPFFRLCNFLRGKNVRRFGSDPEHVHHWHTRAFRTILHDNGFSVIARCLSFPWQLYLVEKKHDHERRSMAI